MRSHSRRRRAPTLLLIILLVLALAVSGYAATVATMAVESLSTRGGGC
jgi:hypothetical protein